MSGGVGFNPPQRSSPGRQGPVSLEMLQTWLSKLGAGVEVDMITGPVQSIPNATVTTVSWRSAAMDTHGFWTVGAPTVLTVPRGLDGVYIAAGTIRWDAHATGYRQQFIGVTSNSGVMTSSARPTLFNADAAIDRIYPLPTRRLYLAAGDEVYAQVNHTAGVALDIEASGHCNLTLTRVGDLPREARFK